MKKFKKLLILGLAVVMSFSLIACSSDDDDDDDDDDKKTEQSDNKDKDDKDSDKDVTAEGLLENMNMDDVESLSADMKLVLDLSMDMKQSLLEQGYTEEAIQSMIDQGQLSEGMLNMGISMKLDAKMEYSKDYSHMKGDMEVSMMGMEQETELETYIDSSDEDKTISYTYNEEADVWYYVKEDKEESSNVTDIADFADYLKEAKIVEDDDDEYVIEMVIDFKKYYKDNPEKAEKLFSSGSDSLSMFDMESVIEELEEMPMTFGIEKETNYLSYVKFDLTDVFAEILTSAASDDESAAMMKAMEMKEFSLEMDLYDFNDVEVEIPDEVIENSEEEINDLWDDDEDIDWEDDEDIDWNDDEDDADVDASVDANARTLTLSNYADKELATLSVPEGFYINPEYASGTFINLKNDDYDSINVTPYPETYAEALLNGEKYEPNMELYTRNEAKELDSIETKLGTVRVFENIWSMDKKPNESYFVEYNLVLTLSDGQYVSVSTDASDLDGQGYTVQTLAKAMFN